MSFLCTTCPTGDVPAGLDSCVLTAQKNTGEFFVIVRCDHQFLDITDPAEWTAMLGSGNAVATPVGFWSKALPAQTSIDAACNVTVQVQEGQEIVFRSGLVASDLSDQTFYKDLRANPQFYRIIPILCDGTFVIEDSYVGADTVVGQSPGFEFSWIVPPDYTVEEGNATIINWNFTARLAHPGILCRRLLPAIYTLLKNS